MPFAAEVKASDITEVPVLPFIAEVKASDTSEAHVLLFIADAKTQRFVKPHDKCYNFYHAWIFYAILVSDMYIENHTISSSLKY